MGKVVGFYTKGGKKIPITKSHSVLLDSSDVTSSHTTRTKIRPQNRFLIRTQKKPWQNGWKKPFAKTKHYSFSMVKKNGMIDYYVEVNKDNQSFLSIPLKPLIQRGISYGLTSITGLPINMESLEVLLQQAITKYDLDSLMKLK